MWSGTSNYLRISEEFSHIFYKIEGKLEYVNKLKVQLFFYKKINLKLKNHIISLLIYAMIYLLNRLKTSYLMKY